MMKKFLIAVAFATLFVACKPKQPDTPKLDVTGSWELSSVSTKVNVGGEQVSVYLNFTAEGTFKLYQKIGAGRYTLFSGSYTIDQDLKQISGAYSSNTAWGPYALECSETTLVLTPVNGLETDTYTHIDAIPESVTGNIY